MARASELIDFRRAFWWLLGGVLLPSVALIAFGVVAVTNERAAVERRLADEYTAKLRGLQTDLRARLDRAAEEQLASLRNAHDAAPRPGPGSSTPLANLPAASAPLANLPAANSQAASTPPSSAPLASLPAAKAPLANAPPTHAARPHSAEAQPANAHAASSSGAPAGDALLHPAIPLERAAPPPGLADSFGRADALPAGGHFFVSTDATGSRKTYAILRTTSYHIHDTTSDIHNLPSDVHNTPSDAQGTASDGHSSATNIRSASSDARTTTLAARNTSQDVGDLSSDAGSGLFVAEVDFKELANEIPRLADALGPHPRATFALLAPLDKSTPLDTLRQLVSEVAPSGDHRATLARLSLDPPLDGFLLTAELSGDDPVAALAFRNRTLYVLMLALLYSAIGTGFGLTLRELYRGAKLSRLKTDFVANISHELRTPLTSVRLFAETLQSGRASSPEEVKECLALLSSEAERLSLLVEKLLDWSRLESGSRLLHREAIEIPALLEQVGEIFRAQQLGASYRTEVEPGLPRVLIDRDAMAQVVINLLHNAVKYTDEDKRIVLRARSQGKRVAIEVQDNGPGVRPHDKKRIFERFYRADDLLSRRTEGTGLGLAIAKRIVEWHGGKIDLESAEGFGSTFRVLLPAEPVESV